MENIGRFKYLIICVILILVLVLAFIIYKLSLPKPENKPIPLTPIPTSSQNTTILPIVTKTVDEKEAIKIIFPPSQKVAQVGEEVIYGGDFNYILSTFYSQDIASSGATLAYLKEKAQDFAVHDSIILQSGKKLGLIQLTPDIFNSIDKDYNSRQKSIRELTNQLKARQEKIGGAIISIWFHNQKLTILPLTEGEKLARKKIEDIYARLQKGEITFQESGKIIQNDQTLASIDKNYKGNAYYEFSDKPVTELIFSKPELTSVLWQLKEGELSHIIRYPKEGTPLGSTDEEFYAIIKVYKRENPGAGSFLGWYKNEKPKYTITIY